MSAPLKAITPEQHQSKTEDWPLLDLEALAEREPQRPAFIVGDWLPCGYASLIAGHGGAGKSGIALNLGVCIASGTPFFGMPVERRRVLYLSCEDRENVLHWRLNRICAHVGIGLASLRGWLNVADLVGRDTVLWERDPRTGYTFTSAFAQLGDSVRDSQAELLIVDGISDTFAGNENARGDVKRYVNAILSLVPADRGAALFVGHIAKPTASNAATTEGYSGSTGWHNSVRARWYLYPETTQGQDGGRPEKTGELVLELQKSNLGRADQQMRFHWDESADVFVGRRIEPQGALERSIRDRTEREGIVAALRACAALQPPVSVPAAMTGPRTAYHVLALRPEFPESLKGPGKEKTRRFWRHIEELRAMGNAREGSITRADRHRLRTLELVV